MNSIRRVVALMALSGSGFAFSVHAATLLSANFNKPGNVLISDQFNNRVIEITPAGDIVWSFGLGPNDISPRSIIGVNDAQRVASFTLIAGTGAPPGTEPKCPHGCPDNRVIIVDPTGKIVWQYGRFRVVGSGPNELNTPVQSTFLPRGDSASHGSILDLG
jgi:hypothetical protein